MKKINQKKDIVVKAKGARLSNIFLDTYIAPKLSSLTEFKARDASEKLKPWVNNFIFNSTFRFKVPEPTKTYYFNFLRRAEGAFIEYEYARKALEDYINTKRNNPERNKISPYFRGLLHFETFIAQLYQAYEFLMTFSKMKLFNRGGGTIIEKIHKLYITSTHMDRRIEEGRLLDNATAAIWITNDGLECKDVKVTFDEIYEALSYTANLASKISSLDTQKNSKEKKKKEKITKNKKGML